jgi:hypothetical protein
LYAVFLRHSARLPGFETPRDGLIYVGKALSLRDRDISTHFATGQTGRSTLRRSLAAILKSSLGLECTYRGHGRAEIDFTNYVLEPSSDGKLTAWMVDSLEIGYCPMPSESVREVEARQIEAERPLLCLQDWPNPHRSRLLDLRKICADEARSQPRRV